MGSIIFGKNPKIQLCFASQVVMEFPEVFWDNTVDYFGAAVGSGPEDRGACFMFWNFAKFAQQPIIAALVSGAAAIRAEDQATEELQVCATFVGFGNSGDLENFVS